MQYRRMVTSSNEQHREPRPRRVAASPNPRVLPDSIFVAVAAMLDSLGPHMTERFARDLRRKDGKPVTIDVVIVPDGESETLLGCEVEETHPGHFTVAISVTLVGLLYCLLVVLLRVPVEEFRSLVWATEGRTIQHRTRLFAEALNLICRDTRDPPSLIRQLFVVGSNRGTRWGAVERLAQLVAERSVPPSDSLGEVLEAGVLLIDVLWMLVVHEIGHVAGRHAEVGALAEAEGWTRLTEEAFIWCAEIDADLYALASLLEVKEAASAEPHAKDSGEFKERLWISLVGLLTVVHSLIHIQESLLAEDVRASLLALRTEPAYEQAAKIMLTLDRYPRASFRANFETHWLAAALFPENVHDKLRDSVPLRRAMYGLKMCAAADWLGLSDLLALAAMAFTDPAMHEGEFSYYMHFRPTFSSMQQEVAVGAAP